MIEGRIFLFMSGLSDINFSSVEFSSLRHEVSDMIADIESVGSLMVIVNLYIWSKKIVSITLSEELCFVYLGICLRESWVFYGRVSATVPLWTPF